MPSVIGNLFWLFNKYFGIEKYTFAGQISYDLNIYSLDGKYTIINGILLPKLFRPTVRKNCSSEIFLGYCTEAKKSELRKSFANLRPKTKNL